MSLLPWDPQKFDVLVEEMNRQHHGLVDAMNELHQRAHAGAGKAELTRLLQHLERLTVRHFREEEAMLARQHYPQLEIHKGIHARLLKGLAEHKQAFLDGPGTFTREFFEYLELWLRSHIMHIDRKYGEHFAHERKKATATATA
ncbi:hemerythrin family protein [Steroidobacter sp. S1-65]|uniref:Hemerythrin family protein n=1 Tax=Steroidobacter gossypii TaxID=2805490 RepID=A0ABS1X228_9GAMM|nr:bacteriohemerythrin [Steroidobacter gossypii]MBM0107257.1 hemerythrin family protein [Steroidobacter gossypii]